MKRKDYGPKIVNLRVLHLSRKEMPDLSKPYEPPTDKDKDSSILGKRPIDHSPEIIEPPMTKKLPPKEETKAAET